MSAMETEARLVYDAMALENVAQDLREMEFYGLEEKCHQLAGEVRKLSEQIRTNSGRSAAKPVPDRVRRDETNGAG